MVQVVRMGTTGWAVTLDGVIVRTVGTKSQAMALAEEARA